MRARAALVALVAAAPAPAAAKPRATHAVVLFSNGDGPETFEPVACAGPHDTIAGGAACLAAGARGPIAVAGGAALVRATRMLPPCASGQDDGPRTPPIPTFVTDRKAGVAELAVWPASADAALRLADETRLAAPTAAEQRAVGADTITEVFVDDLDGDGVAERVLVAVDRGRGMPVKHADLVIVDGADPKHVIRLHASFPAATDAEVVGSSDVDGDGKRELIVRYPAVNDYGLAVWEYGTPDPVYQFDCGNV